MASSSKVQFKLGILKAQAVESIDTRIAQKQEEVDSYLDNIKFEERVTAWRDDQIQRIAQLQTDIRSGECSDKRLADFKIQSMPEQDDWSARRAQTDLNGLTALRSKIVAKSESLVADEDGNISLTKTQLAEFFGL